MFERVFSAADIEGVAVGEEGHAALLLDMVRNDAGEVGTEEGKVAWLAEVKLDGGKLSVEGNIIDAGFSDEAVQLIQQVVILGGAKIGEVNFRHRVPFCNSFLYLLVDYSVLAL